MTVVFQPIAKFFRTYPIVQGALMTAALMILHEKAALRTEPQKWIETAVPTLMVVGIVMIFLSLKELKVAAAVGGTNYGKPLLNLCSGMWTMALPAMASMLTMAPIRL
jgi:uncharacterized membrane protein